MGLRVALSTKYAQDQMTIVESFDQLESHKTRELFKVLRQTYGDEMTLIVSGEENEKLELAARNIPRVEVIHVDETNVLDLLTYNKLIIDKSAVDILEETLAA